LAIPSKRYVVRVSQPEIFMAHVAHGHLQLAIDSVGHLPRLIVCQFERNSLASTTDFDVDKIRLTIGFCGRDRPN